MSERMSDDFFEKLAGALVGRVGDDGDRVANAGVNAFVAEAHRSRRAEILLLEAIRVGAARVEADPALALPLLRKLASVLQASKP